MKTIILILGLFAVTGCNKNDDDNNATNQENDLFKSWSLISFSPGFGQPENFDINEIVWTFNSDNSVEVNVSANTSEQLPLNETGVYSYQMISTDTLSVESVHYKFQIDGDTLILMDNPASDGPMLTFQNTN